MIQLIDKYDVIAEIEKVADEPAPSHDQQCPWKDGYYCGLYKVMNILDTLEVKEVDLEKEIENLIEKEKAFVTDDREVKYYNGDSFNHIYELEFIAKYFFELGLKAQKGE